MKLFFVSLGVLCAHLALLWWASVAPRITPPKAEATPIWIQQVPVLTPPPLATAEPTIRRQDPTKRHPKPAAPVPTPPRPFTTPVATPTPNTPLSALPPAPTSQSAVTTRPQPAPPVPASTPATPSVTTGTRQLPSSTASYLNNPPPIYPPLSRRLGEQGKVVVHVLIGIEGLPLQGDIAESSGYDRLDQAALQAVLRWRYVPGQIDGKPQTMWFLVPIHFKLD